MSIAQGLRYLEYVLRTHGSDIELYLDFLGFSRKLYEIEEKKRRFNVLGNNDMADREHVLRELDSLSLNIAGMSFENLCERKYENLVLQRSVDSHLSQYTVTNVPHKLTESLRNALLECDEFQSHGNVISVFDEAGLSSFARSLPRAEKLEELADQVIDFLVNKKLVSGENALVLLVRLLRDRKNPKEELYHRLSKIVSQLDWLEEIDPNSSAYKPEANPEREPMLQSLEIEIVYRTAISVAHLEIPRYFNGQPKGACSSTAWMIAPGLAITCYHVLRARNSYELLDEADLSKQVANALLTFDFLSSGRGTQYRILRIEHQNEEFDYTVLRLDERALMPTDQWGHLKLALSDVPLTTQTSLSVIQHPLGQPQQCAFGKFAQMGDTIGIIHYRVPTEQGTSGAPVLNRQDWRVIALHQGESQSIGLRQGRLISSIMSDLYTNNQQLHQEIQLAQSRRP